MIHFILFLHILGAVGMGFYLLLPVLCIPIRSQDGKTQVGYLHSLRMANQSAMYLLALQLITGIYLYSQGDYTLQWTIAFAVPFLAMGPLTGNISRQLGNTLTALKANHPMNANAGISKIQVLSALTWIAMLLVLIFMVYPA